MGAPKGNKFAIGNRGGYRKGYEWEEDQLKKMSSHMNWLLAYVDACRKGKATEKQHVIFTRIEKVLLKEMDKLHGNKQSTDITSGGEKITIPIYDGKSLSKHDSDAKYIPIKEEN